ncbi:MAG: DnaD domain protein [Eubacterium sp.]
MNFYRQKISDFFLRDTNIENIFINEYLPAAPGDYVKVFIYGYMYAQYGMEISEHMIAEQLGLSEKLVAQAWNYWEDLGLIRKTFVNGDKDVNLCIEFVNLKDEMYGTGSSEADQTEDSQSGVENLLDNDSLQRLFSQIESDFGRSLSSTEVKTILGWITEDKITPEVVQFCVQYCLQKNKTGMKYISAVVHGWASRGLNTVDAVKDYLQEVDQRYYQYRRILQALGFTRNATEAEKNLMDSWFDDMGYNIDKILEACSKTAGISNPNFNYVDKVLKNWKTEADKQKRDVNARKPVTQAVLNQYYEYLRRTEEKEAQERLQEVYEKIPRIKEIDEETRQLSSDLTKAMLQGRDSEEAGKRAQMDRLAEERAVLLTDHNYDMGYTDIHHRCEKCGDTGITDLGEQCTCVEERMKEAEVWQHQLG